MARRKKDEFKEQFDTTLTNKEVLIAYCSTLSDDKCKRAYRLLRDEFNVDTSKVIRLNEFGVQDDRGLLRIKRKQLDKALTSLGEYKFKWCIGCIYGYLDYLKEQVELGNPKSKRQYRIYTTESIYPQLMSGWVQNRYAKEAHPPIGIDSGYIDFYTIKTESDALEYVQNMPIELLEDSPEIDFLTTKFPKVLEYIKG